MTQQQLEIIRVIKQCIYYHVQIYLFHMHYASSKELHWHLHPFHNQQYQPVDPFFIQDQASLASANTKRPPITLVSISTLAILHCPQDFWRNVVGHSYSHVALYSSILSQAKAKSKVCKTDMTVSIKKNIVWFDIFVDISEVVDRVYGKDHLCDVELGHILWKSVLELAEEGQEVSATVIVLHKVIRLLSRCNPEAPLFVPLFLASHVNKVQHDLCIQSYPFLKLPALL